MSDGDTHEPVVSKTVADADGVTIPSRLGRELGDLLFGVASGRQIELIGLVRELRDACEIRLGERRYFGFLLQGTVEVLARCDVLLELLALALCVAALVIVGGPAFGRGVLMPVDQVYRAYPWRVNWRSRKRAAGPSIRST